MDAAASMSRWDPSPASPAFSDVVRRLGERAGAGYPVTLGRALEVTETRAHGAAILLLALPESIPIPIPSFGAVLGIPLIAVSAHLAIYGERRFLPKRLLRRRLPGPPLATLADHVAPWLKWAERATRVRLTAISGRERAVGAACLLMAVLLFLPIPLINVPAAMSLVLMAWGLIQRDGAFVLLGVLVGAVLCAALVFTAEALIGLLR